MEICLSLAFIRNYDKKAWIRSIFDEKDRKYDCVMRNDESMIVNYVRYIKVLK